MKQGFQCLALTLVLLMTAAAFAKQSKSQESAGTFANLMALQGTWVGTADVDHDG